MVSRKKLKSWGLTQSDWYVINALANAPSGMDVESIAMTIGWSPSHTRKALKAAERKNLVRSRRIGKPKIYHLTERGRMILANLSKS